ncbi:phosphodiester glycosidase family protein [Papillibacter cinnamivorans]|uniref:Exopolysaccharide biosynthesis protein n=1 Tax=Papillibacter cinnamivorans DSM 12816 TaxID=1122930 RepID=A0A1W1YDH1_9FIRM|nr:phosphodiester glycosidase family protein [Papillibacter cinnamivorans]SMC34183.1 Exopolysaccharide biosynthesis protein [Papillibacter cinnamivorans DSM 12816]
MKILKKPYVWAALFSVLLAGFTLFVLLDTFAISRVYVVVVGDSSQGSEDAELSVTDESSAPVSSDGSQEDAAVTENSYSDGNITITISEYKKYNTTIYVADVVLSDPDALKTAFAESSYGKNVTEKTSAVAEETGAILAINGDFYGARNSGYVIRNGVLYRDTSAGSSQEDLVINQDGSFEIVKEGSVSAAQLLEDGAQQVLSFGPGLLQDGEITVTKSEEVDKAMTSNPRTAVGIIDSLHYVFVVSDGRTSESEGLTLYELASFLQGLGVQTAYNLDGGGSSTMVFCGSVINNPTTDGKTIRERSVSDIVYIGY